MKPFLMYELLPRARYLPQLNMQYDKDSMGKVGHIRDGYCTSWAMDMQGVHGC
jgi:predicted SPOUT superfamily RNA methylase MTH1